MLTRRGVTAWRQALASLAPAGRHTPGTSTAAPARQTGVHPARADLPAPVAAELINVLAALVLARAATTSPPP